MATTPSPHFKERLAGIDGFVFDNIGSGVLVVTKDSVILDGSIVMVPLGGQTRRKEAVGEGMVDGLSRFSLARRTTAVGSAQGITPRGTPDLRGEWVPLAAETEFQLLVGEPKHEVASGAGETPNDELPPKTKFIWLIFVELFKVNDACSTHLPEGSARSSGDLF